MNNKRYIKAIRNGQFVGYVKSVSYSRGTFTLTKDINEAKTKGYTSEDAIHREIDILTRMGAREGFIFVY